MCRGLFSSSSPYEKRFFLSRRSDRSQGVGDVSSCSRFIGRWDGGAGGLSDALLDLSLLTETVKRTDTDRDSTFLLQAFRHRVERPALATKFCHESPMWLEPTPVGSLIGLDGELR